MNDRFVRTLALLFALALAAPAAALGAGSAPAAAAASTASDKAAEAKRLAAMAAELAQRAAQLEAESKAAAPAPATHLPPTTAVNASAAWSPRGAAEIEITDADEPTPSGGSLSSGWRRHRKPSEVAIRFMNDPTPSAASDPTPIATTQSADTTTAPPANAGLLSNAAAALANAAMPTRTDPTIPSSTTPLNATAAKPAPAAPPTASGPSHDQPLSDANVRLAARTFQDDEDVVPDSEPLPPAPAYTERNGGENGKGSNGQGTGGSACGCGNDNCSGGCASGCCDCCQPRPMLFWTSGIEATFLNPDLNNDGVGFEVVEFANDREDFFSTVSDETDSFYLAPRLWFGVQGCKWGVNFRYFHLQAGEGSYDPTLGSDGEWDGPNCGTPNFGYSSCTQLEAYYVDLEVTRRFCLNNCQMQVSGGVRHADLSYDELLTGTALTDDSQVFGFGTARRETRGTGVVFGWYGRRPVFPCSCVHWFYNIRGSVVWGPTQTASETGVMLTMTTTDPDAVAAAGSVNGASTYVDNDMWIGEFQVGLEWDYALQCLPANAFCRAAFEYQRWTGGIGYSAANSFAGVEIDDEPTTLADAFASAAAPELDLLGIAVSAGLTW